MSLTGMSVHEAAEPVEVGDAEVVELRVLVQQLMSLNCPPAVCASFCSCAIAGEDQQTLIAGAHDVALREVVTVARERQRLRRRSCAARRAAKYAPEYGSCISVGTFISNAADAVDERDEAVEVDVDRRS